jgi:hypothetical protein
MLDLIIFVFNLIPEYIVHLWLIAGIVIYIGYKFIPLALKYKLVAKILGLVLIITGIYLQGMLAISRDYREKAAEFQHKIELANIKSNNINESIKYVYKDKVSKSKEKSITIQENIKNNAREINRNCIITPEINRLHNSFKELHK